MKRRFSMGGIFMPGIHDSYSNVSDVVYANVSCSSVSSLSRLFELRHKKKIYYNLCFFLSHPALNPIGTCQDCKLILGENFIYN